jgi:hypothetical protein
LLEVQLGHQFFVLCFSFGELLVGECLSFQSRSMGLLGLLKCFFRFGNRCCCLGGFGLAAIEPA